MNGKRLKQSAMMGMILPLFVVTLLAGCTAAAVVVPSGASTVQIGNEVPEGPHEQIGTVSAKHGGGCGLFGSPAGTYKDAVALLQDKAAKMGADYVQVLRTLRERLTTGCLDRGVQIDGMAYRLRR